MLLDRGDIVTQLADTAVKLCVGPKSG
jgi:hypothetical protein